MRNVAVDKHEKQRADYRRMLLARRSEVLASLGMRFDTLASIGRVAEEDQGQLSHDEFISLHLNSLEYAKLVQIEEALARLNEGDYGICLECGLPVSVKRLKAIPWARYCIDCETRQNTPQAA